MGEAERLVWVESGHPLLYGSLPPSETDHPLSSFEYVSVLASIIVGFALSDMLRSLGMLLKARGRVRWIGQPL